jgi:outer membrane receptor protein involved in Fe transport
LPAFRSWEQNDNVLVQAHFLGGARDLNQNFKTPKDDFNTHELRIASKDDATVKWQGGVFYYDNKLSNTNHNFLVNSDGTEFVVESDTSDTRSTTSLGYFAETTIPFTDSLRTTLGARYDNTKVAVTELYYENPDSQCGLLPFAPVGAPSPSGSGAICTGVSQSTDPFPPHTPFDKTIKKSNFNYKARLEFDLTQKNMMYGMISTGFRPGDAQVVTRRDPPNPTVTAPNVVEPEKLTAIEIGSKNRFFDDSLQVNVSLYAYRYQGFATSYKQSASSFSGIPITVPARNLGSELELLYQLTSHDRVGLNYSYTESRWYDKPAVFAAAQPEKKRAGTPHIVTANYEHVFNLPGGSTLSTRIDGKYESSHLTTNLHAGYVALGYEQYVYAKAQTIGNLNGTWSSNGGRYGVSAYVRNFADVKYTSIVNFGGLLSQQTVNWNDPRTYGVILSAKF